MFIRAMAHIQVVGFYPQLLNSYLFTRTVNDLDYFISYNFGHMNLGI